MQHLPVWDLSLIVLKGRLLIEELLYVIVAKSMTAHPESLFEAGLTFRQLAHIANALTYQEGSSFIWNAGTLRLRRKKSFQPRV